MRKHLSRKCHFIESLLKMLLREYEIHGIYIYYTLYVIISFFLLFQAAQPPYGFQNRKPLQPLQLSAGQSDKFIIIKESELVQLKKENADCQSELMKIKSKRRRLEHQVR